MLIKKILGKYVQCIYKHMYIIDSMFEQIGFLIVHCQSFIDAYGSIQR
jgi:hypothetical protein